MKKIENLLLRAAGYTVLILLIFYIFGLLSDFSAPYIDFPTFLLILGFGVIISAVGLIFTVQKLHFSLRVLIHYAVLLTAFSLIFISTGNISKSGSGAVFVAVAIFTVFYAAIFGICCAIIYAIRKADAKIDKKIKAELKKEAKKEKYKPLYKSED